MANSCLYKMHVKGDVKNIEEFLRVMTDYDYDRHFWRVFSAEAYGKIENEDGSFTYYIDGECAWAVYSCMLMKNGAYATGDNEKDTSLQLESKRLNLEIEVFSEEEGMGFQEHFHYKNGEIITEESVDASCHYFDKDLYKGESVEEKFSNFVKELKEYGLKEEITIEDLDDNDEIWIGGFEDFMLFSF